MSPQDYSTTSVTPKRLREHGLGSDLFQSREAFGRLPLKLDEAVPQLTSYYYDRHLTGLQFSVSKGICNSSMGTVENAEM